MGLADWLLVIAAGYLLGSVPWGFCVVQGRKGLDIRKVGSGNIGATNVLRAVGPGWGVAVLCLDVAKGALSVLFARWVGGDPLLHAVAGAAAIAGHTWTFWLSFRGGRGVATGLGVLMALSPPVAAIAGLAFLLVVVVTRYVSLGSLTASAVAALAAYLYTPYRPYQVMITLAAAVIVYRHVPNFRRLLRGEEPKLGKARAGS